MIKTATKILIACLALLGINSCNLDMYGTYTFQSKGQYIVKDENEETTGKAISEYFTSVIDFTKTPTFTGTYYDAVAYGSNLFAETLKELDNDYINGLLAEGEEVVYMMTMSGKKTNMTIGLVRWPFETGDEEGGTDTGTGTGTTQHSLQ